MSQKEYSTIRNRAVALGYDHRVITPGLSRYVGARIPAAGREESGPTGFPVKYWEVTPELDTTIRAYFGAKKILPGAVDANRSRKRPTITETFPRPTAEEMTQAAERLRELFTDKIFHPAKTAIKNPHEYTLLREWSSRDKFMEAVKIIRRCGYLVYFWGRPYIIFDLDGMRYWSMDYDVNDTILINRAWND